MRTNGRNRWAALATLAMLASHAAVAAEGDIDPSFGDAGLAMTGLIDVSAAVCGPLVQPDGKILVCNTRLANGSSGSDFFVARFTADGQLDPTFSFDGKTTIDFDAGAGIDAAGAMALYPDGRIIVVGTTASSATFGSQTRDFAIARLLPDGGLDTSFGSGTGKKTVAFNLDTDTGLGDDTAIDVAIQANGRIVVAGTAQRSQAIGNDDFAVTRLLADGTPDSSFNLSGKATLAFDLPTSTTKADQLQSMAIDDDGRIVLAGSANKETDNNDFAFARLLANGQPDPDFDADGRATLAFDLGETNADTLSGISLQRDGKLVAIGMAARPTGANSDWAIARLLPDGTPDATFGVLGQTVLAFDLTADGTDTGLSIIEDPAGRLLLCGAAQWLGSPGYAVAAAFARLDRHGEPDPTFGLLGKRTFQFGLADADSQAFLGIAFQGSQPVVSGISIVPGLDSPIDNFLVRLETDLIFANGFE